MNSIDIIDEINRLRAYQQTLSWFGRLFFPGALSRALTENAPNLSVIQAAYNSTWFFQRWFLAGLYAFFQSPLMKATKPLFDTRVINQTFTAFTTSEAPDEIAAALFSLNMANQQKPNATRLAQENARRITSRQTQILFICLNQLRLLNLALYAQNNFMLAFHHTNANGLTEALTLLRNARLLELPITAQGYFTDVATAFDPVARAEELIRGPRNGSNNSSNNPQQRQPAPTHPAQNAGARTSVYQRILEERAAERARAAAISNFSTTYPTLSAMFQHDLDDHDGPSWLSSSPSVRTRYEEQRSSLSERDREEALQTATEMLLDLDLFENDRDIEAVTAHNNPVGLLAALTQLRNSNFLNQANFHTILRDNNPRERANQIINPRVFPAAAAAPARLFGHNFSFQNDFNWGFQHFFPNDPLLARRSNAGSAEDRNPNTRESSMRALTADEEARLNNASRHYQPIIESRGGVEACFQALLTELQRRYNQAPIRVPGIDQPLPLTWDAFQRMPLSIAQRERAKTAYHQHEIHTALRCLSKPNAWLSEHAHHARSEHDRTGRELRFSAFEDHKQLIVLHWLGASDTEILPAQGQGNLNDRINFFFSGLAYVGRGHNWDDTRVKHDLKTGVALRDHNNQEIMEYFDNVAEGDKPSCSGGMRARVSLSVQNHRLFTANMTLEMLEEELIDFVREQFKQYIQRLSVSGRETLAAAWDEIITTGRSSTSPINYKASLDALNISPYVQSTFFRELERKYPTFQQNADFRRTLEERFRITLIHSSHVTRFAGSRIDIEALIEESAGNRASASSSSHRV